MSGIIHLRRYRTTSRRSVSLKLGLSLLLRLLQGLCLRSLILSTANSDFQFGSSFVTWLLIVRRESDWLSVLSQFLLTVDHVSSFSYQ